MTLDVRIDQNSTTVPIVVVLHIAATDGIVMETNYSITKNGLLVPEVGNSTRAGVAVDTIIGINYPGSYVITVNRTGFTGPDGPATLTKRLNIIAHLPGPQPPPPPQIRDLQWFYPARKVSSDRKRLSTKPSYQQPRGGHSSCRCEHLNRDTSRIHRVIEREHDRPRH